MVYIETLDMPTTFERLHKDKRNRKRALAIRAVGSGFQFRQHIKTISQKIKIDPPILKILADNPFKRQLRLCCLKEQLKELRDSVLVSIINKRGYNKSQSRKEPYEDVLEFCTIELAFISAIEYFDIYAFDLENTDELSFMSIIKELRKLNNQLEGLYRLQDEASITMDAKDRYPLDLKYCLTCRHKIKEREYEDASCTKQIRPT